MKDSKVLITPLPPQPRGLMALDEPIVDALRASVALYADQLSDLSWIWADRPPAVCRGDAEWLRHWLHAHFAIAVEL